MLVVFKQQGLNNKAYMLLSRLHLPRYYIWIGLIGLAVRLLWAIAVPVVPVSDSHAYDLFARNLATCQTYGWECHQPSAYWPVGTSFVYAVLYRLFGQTYSSIVVLNLLLAIVTIWSSMLLAEQWFGRRVAALTGLIFALLPSQIEFTTVLASEQLFTALSLLAVLLWTQERLSLWWRAAIVGAVLAATCYVRPTALLIPMLLLFLRFVSTREIRRSLVATGLMLAVMGLLIAPWSLRNVQVFGQFVLISTNGGTNLWMGNNPTSTGTYMDLPRETDQMNEAERDKYLKAIAVAYIKEQPVLFVRRSVQRIIDTYSRESIGVVWNEPGLTRRYGNRILMPLKLLNQLAWLPLLLLGIAGIGLLIAQRGWWMTLTHPTVLLWGYFTAVHAVIVAQDRYHFPAIPLIATLAAVAIVALLEWVNKPNRDNRFWSAKLRLNRQKASQNESSHIKD